MKVGLTVLNAMNKICHINKLKEKYMITWIILQKHLTNQFLIGKKKRRKKFTELGIARKFWGTSTKNLLLATYLMVKNSMLSL